VGGGGGKPTYPARPLGALMRAIPPLPLAGAARLQHPGTLPCRVGMVRESEGGRGMPAHPVNYIPYIP